MGENVRENVHFLKIKHLKMQVPLMGLIVLTMVFVCGCGSLDSDAEYVRPEGSEFQAEDTESIENTVIGTDFESARAVVEEFLNMMNLDEQSLVKSWNTEADEDLYYLQIIMDETTFRDIYQSQNYDEIRQLWKDNIREPLKGLTQKCNEIFLQYGFDTDVCVEIVNPFDTNKAILSIMDGIVLYDMMGEWENMYDIIKMLQQTKD